MSPLVEFDDEFLLCCKMNEYDVYVRSLSRDVVIRRLRESNKYWVFAQSLSRSSSGRNR